MATRREFLGAAAGAAWLPSGPAAAATAVQRPDRLLAAVHTPLGGGGVIWQARGSTPLVLPGRGHGVVGLGRGEAMIVSRRPGQFAALLDLRGGAGVRALLSPAPGCVFSGHAAVDASGGMVTSEFVSGTYAAVAVRRKRDGSPSARWELPGIEPHDMTFACGGERLVVAIGGLIHDGGPAGPAFNAGGIESALVELEPGSGRILARHRLAPEYASLSMRHLALAPGGSTVLVGMQDQDLGDRRPLMALLHVGRGIDFMTMPDPQECDFRGYAGSVAIDASGRYAAATSPRGGVVGLWSMADGRWLGGLHVPDVCGLARTSRPAEFWISSGVGRLASLRASPAGLAIRQQWATGAGFDNHLLHV